MNKKWPLAITAVMLSILIPFTAYAKSASAERVKLSVFYSAGCHRCNEIKLKLIPRIEEKFKERIELEYRDISALENYKLLLSLQEKYNAKFKIIVPVFFLKGHFLNGDKAGAALEEFVGKSLAAPGIAIGQETPLPQMDLLERFKGFKLFTVSGAGLIDGINPCAFTVIVFFISFLALQGYLKRELIIIGLCFIFAVFITYVSLGLGAFGFLYRLSKFWAVAKAINFSIGIFSLILGFLALYDFFKFKKTGKTEGLVLQLPGAIKEQIHKLVGLHYRMHKKEGPSSKRHLLRLIASALITGFLVSILEAVCTGQTYLPTITFILKATPLKLQALGYLLLYNFMFIVPLLAIFIFALFGVTSEQFSAILKKHLLLIKILMAILFFGLGAFLIWRA